MLFPHWGALAFYNGELTPSGESTKLPSMFVSLIEKADLIWRAVGSSMKLHFALSPLASIRLLRIPASLRALASNVWQRDSIFVDFHFLYVFSILPDSHQSLSRGRLIVFKESTSLHLR
jgi:hypothetical protein